MVQYTSPDCLPYFDCDDSPCLNTGSVCDPSTVWCDFATLVDARLDEFDAAVQRTAISTPMAWVQATVPTLVVADTPATPIVFDSPLVDTDNMVNLDTLPSSITVNTSGLYQFVYSGVGVMTNGGAATTTLAAQLAPNAPTYPISPPSFTQVDFESPITGLVVTPMISVLYPLVAGQSFSMSAEMTGVTAPDNTLYSLITAGLIWMADLP
jgi:hypothetical protein